MTLAMVEAVMLGRREASEELAHAQMPDRWPNRELIERAFPVTLDDLRADPAARLWGARVMVADVPSRRVVGSIVFHGQPGPDGIAENRVRSGGGLAAAWLRHRGRRRVRRVGPRRGGCAGGPGDHLLVAPPLAPGDRERRHAAGRRARSRDPRRDARLRAASRRLNGSFGVAPHAPGGGRSSWRSGAPSELRDPRSTRRTRRRGARTQGWSEGRGSAGEESIRRTSAGSEEGG